jgi:hypothetical protein
MGHDLPGLPWYDDEFFWSTGIVRGTRGATPVDHRGRVSMFGLASEDHDPA